jgi:hypothetical protein
VNLGDVITGFLSWAYDKLGLRILNDSAAKVPAVRYAGAALIVAMLAATGLSLFQRNLPLLIVTVVTFVCIAALLIILGAVATQKDPWPARIFSWGLVIAVTGAIMTTIIVLSISFLFHWPRPDR